MKKYKSEASMAIHEVAEAMNAAGIIPDERMRRFDEACLVKPSTPQVPTQKPSTFAHSSVPAFASGKQ
jgi:DNA-binding transcriptional regulator YiaG